MKARGAFATAAIALLAVSSVAGIGAAGTQSAPSEALIVNLQTDGDATVELRQTFDLTTDSERVAFERLRNNETRTTQLRRTFADGLRGVAQTVASETDREMRIEDPSVTVESTDSTGTITLSVTWTELAATGDDRVTLQKPFAESFQPNRPLVVQAPDSYELQTMAPSPDSTAAGQAVWNANRTLSGFEVAAVPTDSPQSPTSSAGPGFGIVAVLSALLALAVFLGIRR